MSVLPAGTTDPILVTTSVRLRWFPPTALNNVKRRKTPQAPNNSAGLDPMMRTFLVFSPVAKTPSFHQPDSRCTCSALYPGWSQMLLFFFHRRYSRFKSLRTQLSDFFSQLQAMNPHHAPRSIPSPTLRVSSGLDLLHPQAQFHHRRHSCPTWLKCLHALIIKEHHFCFHTSTILSWWCSFFQALLDLDSSIRTTILVA